MSFTSEQLRRLKSSLRRRDVRERSVEGKTLHYIEGWKAVSEANRIFGFESWDRETVSSECVWRTATEQGFAAAYVTRVRIRVRAGDVVVLREGLGCAEAIAATPGQAHERASKAAETDATKRALSTFGNRFGLSLYGERSEAATAATVRGDRPRNLGEAAARVVKDVGAKMKQASTANADGWKASTNFSSAAGARKDMRDDLGDQAPADGWRATRAANPFTRGIKRPEQVAQESGAQLPASPHVASGAAGQATASPSLPAPSVLLPVYLPPESTGRVDKSVLALPEPRRIRDRSHLKFVARQPCVVCGRTPSQAHHLRIAQPRALGRKVSDEFTVPLCALHHHDLHIKGNEREWWWGHTIDPLPIAERLWARSRGGEM